MGVFSADVEALGNVKDDIVELVAVEAGKVDALFRRNYAQAKYLADSGAVKKVVVIVRVGGANLLHTLLAVAQAIGGNVLHDAAEFRVEFEDSAYADDLRKLAAKVEDALKVFGAKVVEDVKEAVKKAEPVVVADVKGAVASTAKAVVDEVKSDLKPVPATPGAPEGVTK